MENAAESPRNSNSTSRTTVPLARRLRAHLQIARFDHSIKQVFVLPGVVLALRIAGQPLTLHIFWNIIIALTASTLVACSNYVVNEILDADFDRHHPIKRDRPAANGLVHHGWGYVQCVVMFLVGMYLAHFLSTPFMLSIAILWVMGCLYNIPPIRTKDLPYLDVLSESVNNPIRFCQGWYAVTSLVIPPVTILISYWMLGAYFMALKRFSEYRQIGDPAVAADYRKSFGIYNECKLLNSVLFYGSSSMLFFGAFLMRYRIELVLTFPLIAWMMAIYFSLSFEHESAVQNPEKLYREPRLMLALGLCSTAFILLMTVHLPWLEAFFPKSVPR